MFTSLRGNKPFALLWTSNLFFFGGVWSLTLVLGWLAFELTESEFLVAVFTAARLAPLLLGPWAGALADRFNRVRILLLAAAWATLATAVVAVLAATGTLPYWALVVAGFLLGVAQSPSQPARASLVMDLVGPANISNANALNALAMNVTQVFGPALGGVMISALGAPLALAVTALWFLASLILLFPIRGIQRVTQVDHGSVSQMVVGGFREAIRNRLAGAVLLITVAANLLLWPVYQGFMPVFAEEQFRLDADGLGLLLTCSGIGGLVGALVIAKMGDFRFKGGVFVVGTTIWAALWAMFALTDSALPAFLLMAAVGVTSAAFAVLQNTLLLLMTPPTVHGRMLGIQELAIGVMPISSLVIGLIAEHVGIGSTTFGAAVLMVLFTVAVAVRLPRLLSYTRPAHARGEDEPPR